MEKRATHCHERRRGAGEDVGSVEGRGKTQVGGPALGGQKKIRHLGYKGRIGVGNAGKVLFRRSKGKKRCQRNTYEQKWIAPLRGGKGRHKNIIGGKPIDRGKRAGKDGPQKNTQLELKLKWGRWFVERQTKKSQVGTICTPASKTKRKVKGSGQRWSNNLSRGQGESSRRSSTELICKHGVNHVGGEQSGTSGLGGKKSHTRTEGGGKKVGGNGTG